MLTRSSERNLNPRPATLVIKNVAVDLDTHRRLQRAFEAYRRPNYDCKAIKQIGWNVYGGRDCILGLCYELCTRLPSNSAPFF